MANLIYTYEKTTGIVCMVSESPNTYTSEELADVELDESYFSEWDLNGGVMRYEDGAITFYESEEDLESKVSTLEEKVSTLEEKTAEVEAKVDEAAAAAEEKV